MHTFLVNIGCGATWHPAWTNLDVCPLSSHVQAWDVEKGLPFESGQVDACYASHLLEHLTKDQARDLLLECFRVLRPGGVIRLAVPDLEGIVREYLRVLALAESGERAAVEQYEWISLELLDQLVRDRSGGEMERYLRTQAWGNAEYVVARIGPEAMTYMGSGREQDGTSGTHESSSDGAVSGRRLLPTISAMAREIRSVLSGAGHFGAGVWGRRVNNGDREAVRVGRFRLAGECHRWMYDRFSLRQLLGQSGFADARLCSAFESRINGFASFGLDAVDGRVRKPDSLFMEAIKP